MVGWQWEAFKMVIYISFPVGLFHWFNQPENFTEYIEEVHRLYMPKAQPGTREKIENFIEEFNKEKDLARIKAMEASLEGKE